MSKTGRPERAHRKRDAGPANKAAVGNEAPEAPVRPSACAWARDGTRIQLRRSPGAHIRAAWWPLQLAALRRDSALHQGQEPARTAVAAPFAQNASGDNAAVTSSLTDAPRSFRVRPLCIGRSSNEFPVARRGWAALCYLDAPGRVAESSERNALSTASPCSAARARFQTFASVPSGPTMKVARVMPMLLLP